MQTDMVVLCTWAEIAKLFGVSKRTMQRRKNDLLAAGAVFYAYKGCPPRRVVCGFPRTLMEWAQKG